jgi:glycosyltransferase involved in cell wall biosynthesis
MRERNGSRLKNSRKSVRPALIASGHTLCEYSIFLEHLLVGLADESIQSVLVCPAGCDAEGVESSSVEVISHPVFDLPFMGHRNRKILIEQLEKFRPTVLHCLCESKARLTRQLAQAMGLPYVLMVNSLQSRPGQLSISARRCAKIIVPAKSIAMNLTRIYPKFARRIEQINVGSFVGQTSNCFSEPARLASIVAAGVPRDPGEFENLFEAVRHLVIEGYEFMLVVMGAAAAEKQLRKLISTLGLWQVVSIVPLLKSWRGVLAAVDIFVQPAVSYSFNPLLLEAMSVGASVASCKGGVDDLIIEGQTAVVFDTDDQLSIKAALQRLLNSRDMARKLARACQEYLRENYTVSNMIASILRSYEQAHNW